MRFVLPTSLKINDLPMQIILIFSNYLYYILNIILLAMTILLNYIFVNNIFERTSAIGLRILLFFLLIESKREK